MVRRKINEFVKIKTGAKSTAKKTFGKIVSNPKGIAKKPQSISKKLAPKRSSNKANYSSGSDDEAPKKLLGKKKERKIAPKKGIPKPSVAGKKKPVKKNYKEESEEDEENVSEAEEEEIAGRDSRRGRMKPNLFKNLNKVPRKAPTKSRSKTPMKKTKKQEKVVEEEEESATPASDFESEEEEKPKKKGKKSTTGKSKKKAEASITFDDLSGDKYLEALDGDLITDCCIQCNNKNVIRAVYTQNPTLLKKCIEATKDISSISEAWSKDTNLNVFEIAVKNEDKKTLSQLISYFTDKDKKLHNRVPTPKAKLAYIGSGNTSFQTFGVHVRKVNMTRGGRLGNNAFLENNKVDWKKTLVKAYIKYSEGKALHPFLKTVFFSAEFQDTNKLRFKPEGILSNEMNVYNALSFGNRDLTVYFMQRLKNHESYGFNDLHKAALEKDKVEVKFKPSVNKKSRMAVTPVHFACINPNNKVLQQLIDNTGDFQFVDIFGKRPIHYAAVCEGTGPLKILIAKKVNVNEKDKYKKTPMLYAAESGRLDNIKLLADNEGNVLYKPSASANSAIHYAAMNGYHDIVKYLIEEKEVPVDYPGFNKMTPLHYACNNGDEELVDYLLEQGANVNAKDKFRRTPFLLAAKSGFPRIVALLLDREANFEFADNSGNTPLHYACAYGWLENVKILIKVHANINAVNMWKTTPLEIAILKNHFGIVKYILNNSDVDINTTFDKGNTLLLHTLLNISPKTMDEILYLINEKNADVNLANINKQTPLHLLARLNFEKYIKQFNPYVKIDFNKKYNSMNWRQRNQFDKSRHKIEKQNKLHDKFIAENKDNLQKDHEKLINNLINILIDKGADINFKDYKGESCLFYAIRYKNIPMIKELVMRECELNFSNKKNENVLHFLCDYLFEDYGKEIWELILNKLNGNESVKDLINMCNNNGLTPLLKLTYTYAKGIKEYYYKLINKHYVSLVKAKKGKDKNLKDSDRESIKNKSDGMLKEFVEDTFANIFINLVKLGADSGRVFQKVVQKKNKTKSQGCNNHYGNNVTFRSKAPRKQLATRGMPTSKKEKKKKTAQDKINELTENYLNGFGNTNCLMLLMMFPSFNVLDCLLENGIDINAKDVLSKNAIMYLLQNEFLYKTFADVFSKVFGYLIEKGINVNDQDYHGNTPFFVCARKWLPDEMTILYNNGADCNIQDNSGYNALFYNVIHNHCKRVDFLLKNFNINVDITDQGLKTPLHYVMINDNVNKDIDLNILYALLGKNADPNKLDYLGRSPIFYLFIKENEHCVDAIDPIATLTSLLESRKIDISIKDHYGNNILFYAIQRKSYICFSTLVGKGAKLDATNNDHNTLLAFSILMNSYKTSDLISTTNGINDKVYPLSYKNYTLKKYKRSLKLASNMEVDDESSSEDIKKGSDEDEDEDEEDEEVVDEEAQAESEDESDDIQTEEDDVDYDSEVENGGDNDAGDEDNDDEDKMDIEKDDEKEEEDEYIPETCNEGKVLVHVFSIADSKNSLTYNSDNQITSLINNDDDDDFEENDDEEDVETFSGNSNEYFTHSVNIFSEYRNLKKKDRIKFFEEKHHVTLFDACLVIGNQGLMYYLLGQGYSYILAMQEAFERKKFNLATLLLNKTPKDSRFQQKNAKGQNLFHTLALNISSKCDIDVDILFNTVLSKGVLLEERDNQGCLPIHYSCMKLNCVEFVKFVLNNTNHDTLIAKTNKGYTPFSYCFLEKRIPKDLELFIVILIPEYKKLGNLETIISAEFLANEEKNYYTTPLNKIIYDLCDKPSLTSNDNKNEEDEEEDIEDIKEEEVNDDKEASYIKSVGLESDEDRLLNTLIQNGTSISEKDSNGNDCLMHCAYFNKFELFKYLLKKCKDNIIYDSANNQGKSLIHLLVEIEDLGSYENTAFLEFAIKSGFKYNIPDNQGKKPLDYAYQQLTKKNYKILSKYDTSTSSTVDVIEDVDMKPTFDDFERDSEEYFKAHIETSGEEDLEFNVDPVAKLNKKTHKLIRNSNGNLYDVTLTKVNVTSSLYGDYMFYKMQLIKDNSRNLYILWNRWGRIGTEGAFQRTPFSTQEEAEKEFKKIFKQKTGNDFENIDSFVKHPKKFMLIKFAKSLTKHKHILEDFDLKDPSLPKTELSKPLYDLIGQFTSKAILYKLFSNNHLSDEILSLSILNKDLIKEALDALNSIRIALEDIKQLKEERAKMNKTSKDYEDEKSKLAEIQSQLTEKNEIIIASSNKYYEIIPKNDKAFSIVRPIQHENNLDNEVRLIKELTYVEAAVKIILGAHYRKTQIHPLDYCLKSLNTDIWQLDKTSNEYKFLMTYISNTKSRNVEINNIYGINRQEETMSKYKELPNHVLLFHGSKTYNFMGILSQGLKIAPIEAPCTGYRFGKGIYFSDLFSKSYGYTGTNAWGNNNERCYMLMCEVALGKTFEHGIRHEFKSEKALLNGNFMFNISWLQFT
jgi:ankyrin repeat protein/predicted DNA-binding WGR domain protein